MGGDGPGRQRDEPAKVVNSATQADEDRQRRARLRLAGMGLQFGSTIVGSLVLFLFGGNWLDGRLGTRPLFLLIGMVLAFVAIGYTLYEIAVVKLDPVKSKAKPAAPTPAPRQQADPWDDEREDEDDWPVRRRTDGRDKEG